MIQIVREDVTKFSLTFPKAGVLSGTAVRVRAIEAIIEADPTLKDVLPDVSTADGKKIPLPEGFCVVKASGKSMTMGQHGACIDFNTMLLLACEKSVHRGKSCVIRFFDHQLHPYFAIVGEDGKSICTAVAEEVHISIIEPTHPSHCPLHTHHTCHSRGSHF